MSRYGIFKRSIFKMSAVTCTIHHNVTTCMHDTPQSAHVLREYSVIRCVRIVTSEWLQGFCSAHTRSVYELCVNAAIIYRGPLWHTIPSCQCQASKTKLYGSGTSIPIMTVSALYRFNATLSRRFIWSAN